MAARNPFEPRPVTSRRGGPVKQPLSRDAIVAVALDLLTREGLEGMSLRKVAAALETGPASLYVYVENLQELRAFVLDRALAGVVTAGSPRHDWRRRLAALLESYITVLVRSPGLAQLAMTTIAVGPNALRFVEALLGLLDEGGVAPPTAAWAVDLISLCATAVAAEQSQRDGTTDPLGPIGHALEAVSANEHPRIHALREHLLSGAGPDRFAWALDVLLNGILHTPRGAGNATPPPGRLARRRSSHAR